MRKESNKHLWSGCEDMATNEIGPHKRSWMLKSTTVLALGALQRLAVFQLIRESKNNKTSV